MSHPPSPLELRPFESADAEQVAPWLDGPGLSVPPGQAWVDRLVADRRIVALVAHRGGDNVGLVRLDCAPDGVAELTIVVDAGRRRQGIGAEMFALMLHHARRVGMRRLLANVDVANEAALSFFADMGFAGADLEMRTRLFVTYHSWEWHGFPYHSKKSMRELIPLRLKLLTAK